MQECTIADYCIEMNCQGPGGSFSATVFVAENTGWRMLHCNPDRLWPPGNMRYGQWRPEGNLKTLAAFYVNKPAERQRTEKWDEADVVFRLGGVKFPPDLTEGTYSAIPNFSYGGYSGQWYPIVAGRLLRAAQEKLVALQEELIEAVKALALAGGSMIPGPVGDGFTLAGGAYALRQGDYLGCALCFAALWPVFGEAAAAARAGRLAEHLNDLKKQVNFLARILKRSTEITREEGLTGSALKVAIQRSSRIPAQVRRILPVGSVKPFAGIKSFRGGKVSELCQYLKESGFKCLKPMERPVLDSSGKVIKDSTSEIWVRYHGDVGEVECVRIDPIGHTKVVDNPRGPLTIGPDSTRVAPSNVPHYHLESIPASELQTYLTKFVPTAKQYTADGNLIGKILQEQREYEDWGRRVFAQNWRVPGGVDKFQHAHIPLSAKQ